MSDRNGRRRAYNRTGMRGRIRRPRGMGGGTHLMSHRFNLWMGTLIGRVQQLKERDEGQAMVEYALILGLVSVVAITVLTAIGTDVNTLFGKVKTALDGAI